MRHYTTLQTDKGQWAVAYRNHRGEFISVMECLSLDAAYTQAQAATLQATKEAICATVPATAQPAGTLFWRG